MDPVGPSIASSVAGSASTERAAGAGAKRALEKPREAFKRALDEAELTVSQTEGEGAVRGVAGNEQEEARQDHRERQTYSPAGDGDEPPEQKPALDVNG